MTLTVQWMIVTVTTAVRQATASRHPFTLRPSPMPQSTNILSAHHPWVPGNPTVTPCTAMRSSPSRGPSGSHCGVEGVCVCLCVCVCPTLSPGVERGIGGWKELEASGSKEAASMLSCRHEKFSLPKILPRKSRKPDKKGFALVEGGEESHKAPKSFPGKMGAPWHFKSKPLIPVYSLTA